MTYQPLPETDANTRILALLLEIGSDLDEIAATLVDEDEAAFPGKWAEVGYDRGMAISEYLFAIDDFFNR